MKRTASFKTCCGSRTVAFSNEDSFHGWTDSTVRGGNAGAGTARVVARFQPVAGVVHRQSAGPHRQFRLHADAGYARTPLAFRRDSGSASTVLKHMLDERGFPSSYGIRALSGVHRDHPYHLRANAALPVLDLPHRKETGWH